MSIYKGRGFFILASYLFFCSALFSPLAPAQEERLDISGRCLGMVNDGGMNPSEKKCLDFYRRLVRKNEKGQDVLTATIFYGYLDMATRGLSRLKNSGAYDEGPDEKNKLKNWMLESCAGKDHSRCGFKVSQDHPDVLEKTIQLFGQSVKFQVRLRSVTPEPYNRPNINSSYLREQGDLWRKELAESLRKDSVTLILSHARAGGGPDPYYPVISFLGHHRNIDHYLVEKKGLRLLLGEYAPPGQAQIVGVGTCTSEKYFRQSMEAHFEKMGKKYKDVKLITSKRKLRLIDFDIMSKEIISGISEGECPDRLHQNWKDPKVDKPDSCFHFPGNWKENF